MKHIHESIIGRKNASIWPNPYHLTIKDAIGCIKGYPLEIITLVIKEMKLQNRYHSIRDLQCIDLEGSFIWAATDDGYDFWYDIYNKKFDIFYKTYTPERLRKRLEE